MPDSQDRASFGPSSSETGRGPRAPGELGYQNGNPYASPVPLEITDTAPGRSSPARRAVVLVYLVVFCLVHAVSSYYVFETVRDKQRLSWLHLFSVLVPLPAGISVALYAIGCRPKRGTRLWQAIPFFVFTYALMSLRAAFEQFGGSPLSAEFLGAVAAATVLYGPAIYMSYQLAGSETTELTRAGEREPAK